MCKKNKHKDKGSVISLLVNKIKELMYDLSCKLCNYSKKKDSNAVTIKKNRAKIQRNLFLLCVLIVPIINFFIYYIVVNFSSIIMAFQYYDGKNFVFLSKEQGGLFANFNRFISDMKNDFNLSFMVKNSFMLYFVGLCISMPLQVFTAFFIYKKIPGNRIFKVVLYLPQILSSIVMTVIFRYFVGGAIPDIIKYLGYPRPDLFANDKAFKTIIIYNVWFGMGSGLIIYMGAMSRIPDEIIEYGILEGLPMTKELFKVTLPLIFPTLSVTLITGIAGIFTNQGNIYTFFGEYADATLYTFGYYLFVQVIGENATFAQYPYAAAAGLLFTFIAAPLTLLIKFLLEKFGPEAEF